MPQFQRDLGERSRRLPRWLLAACAVAGLVAMLVYRTTRPVVDLDLWHEMALAREVVQLGYVPRADDFAYTPTVEPVVHHEWGAGMIAYGLANTLGASGILLLKLLLIAALAAACWTCARRRGVGLPLLSCLAPFAILLADEGFSTVRAQMYSFVGLALLLIFLDRDRAGHRRWLLAWLPLFVLWLNLHAGFLVGAGLFAVHWLEQLLRRQPHWHLLLTGLVMVGLIGVNPYGLSYYTYLLHGVTASRPHVSEWRPLWEAAPAKIAFVGFTLLLLAYGIWRNGWARLAGLPLIAITALAALQSKRLLPFYAIAWFCYAPAYLTNTPVGWTARKLWCRRRRFLVAFWCVLTLAMSALAIRMGPWRLVVPGEPAPQLATTLYYPVGAVDYLQQHQFRGNLLTPFDWGSYVSWKMHPQVKVSMDSRFEVAYPLWLEEEVFDFYVARQGWMSLVAKYPTDAILVPTRLPVARCLPELTGWRRCYRDDSSEIYIRINGDLPAVDQRGRQHLGAFP
jgi:hypothetical protein